MKHDGHLLLMTLLLLKLAQGSYWSSWGLSRWTKSTVPKSTEASTAPMVSVPVRVDGVDGELGEFESITSTETEASSFGNETAGTCSASDDTADCSPVVSQVMKRKKRSAFDNFDSPGSSTNPSSSTKINKAVSPGKRTRSSLRSSLELSDSPRILELSDSPRILELSDSPRILEPNDSPHVPKASSPIAYESASAAGGQRRGNSLTERKIAELKVSRSSKQPPKESSRRAGKKSRKPQRTTSTKKKHLKKPEASEVVAADQKRDLVEASVVNKEPKNEGWQADRIESRVDEGSAHPGQSNKEVLEIVIDGHGDTDVDEGLLLMSQSIKEAIVGMSMSNIEAIKEDQTDECPVAIIQSSKLRDLIVGKAEVARPSMDDEPAPLDLSDVGEQKAEAIEAEMSGQESDTIKEEARERLVEAQVQTRQQEELIAIQIHELAGKGHFQSIQSLLHMAITTDDSRDEEPPNTPKDDPCDENVITITSADVSDEDEPLPPFDFDFEPRPLPADLPTQLAKDRGDSGEDIDFILQVEQEQEQRRQLYDYGYDADADDNGDDGYSEDDDDDMVLCDSCLFPTIKRPSMPSLPKLFPAPHPNSSTVYDASGRRYSLPSPSPSAALLGLLPLATSDNRQMPRGRRQRRAAPAESASESVGEMFMGYLRRRVISQVDRILTSSSSSSSSSDIEENTFTPTNQEEDEELSGLFPGIHLFLRQHSASLNPFARNQHLPQQQLPRQAEQSSSLLARPPQASSPPSRRQSRNDHRSPLDTLLSYF